MESLIDFSQATGFSGSQQDYNIMRALAAAQQQQSAYYKGSGGTTSMVGNGGGGNINNHSPHHSPHPPGSPQLPPSPQSPPQAHHLAPTSPTQLTQDASYQNVSPQLSPQNQTKKIPDIIFTGE